MTTSELLEFIPNNLEYLICPYTERLYSLLSEQYLTEWENNEIVESSNQFFRMELGKNETKQTVKKFGVIHLERLIEYQEVHSSYLLILVEPE